MHENSQNPTTEKDYVILSKTPWEGIALLTHV